MRQMETVHRNRYLGIETETDESRKFKVRMAVALTVVGLATGLLLMQETRNFYKGNVTMAAKKARKAGRKFECLFQ